MTTASLRMKRIKNLGIESIGGIGKGQEGSSTGIILQSFSKNKNTLVQLVAPSNLGNHDETNL